jgi:hypothetical protein
LLPRQSASPQAPSEVYSGAGLQESVVHENRPCGLRCADGPEDLEIRENPGLAAVVPTWRRHGRTGHNAPAPVDPADHGHHDGAPSAAGSASTWPKPSSSTSSPQCAAPRLTAAGAALKAREAIAQVRSSARQVNHGQGREEAARVVVIVPDTPYDLKKDIGVAMAAPGVPADQGRPLEHEALAENLRANAAQARLGWVSAA